MGETKKFKTLVKSGKDVKKVWRGNTYIRGRISGILCGICRNAYYPVDIVENGKVYTVECTPEKYAEATEVIEEHYPGLCEFNYQEK